jgi:hypothetical protein
MTLLGSEYREVRDLITLFARMGGRLSNLARTEHCRTAVLSLYGLHDIGKRGGAIPSDQRGMVELHIVVNKQAIMWRDAAAHLLVLHWEYGSFFEAFNGAPLEAWREQGRRKILLTELVDAEILPEQRLPVLEPHAPRDYLGNADVAGGNGDGDGDGGAGGRDGGADGEGPGGGGLREVVGHPVLFSAEPETYRRILEDY